jgi:thiol-disulfide isomerase/thioredoxin
MNTPAQPPRSKTGVLLAVGIAVAAALGFLVQRHLQPAPTVTAAPAPAAEPVAEASQTPKLVVPETLPGFELKDRDGKPRKLADWAGRPLMVNYWATWCAPCRREIPLLNKLRADRAGQKLEIIGIAVDFRDDVLAYARTQPLNYPLLIGEEDGLAAVTAVGMQPNFPFTLFADSRQRIVAVKVGELHQDEADLIVDRIIAIDAGKLDLPTARAQIDAGLQKSAAARAAVEAAKAAKGANNT